jgi:hypothetical protein
VVKVSNCDFEDRGFKSHHPPWFFYFSFMYILYLKTVKFVRKSEVSKNLQAFEYFLDLLIRGGV